MTNGDARRSLRGVEEIIFDHLCLSATTARWAEWLKTPFRYAAAAGDIDVTMKLLAAGAKGNGMMAAVRGGHDELVEDLLQAGVRRGIRYEQTSDRTLHVAAALGHSGIVSSLGREWKDIDETDSEGCTPLHLAAERGHLLTVQALLAAGAGVNVLSAFCCQSALVFACRGGHLGTVTALIHHGADVRASPEGYGTTVLHHVAMLNHPECITVLIEAGADMEAPRGIHLANTRPLHSAAEAGCAEAVSALLRHGAAKDSRQASDGYTPLHLAIHGRHVLAVEALVSAGADVSLRDSSGSGPVNMAVTLGHLDILRSLIVHRADVNAVTPSKRYSPLVCAVFERRLKALHTLVEAGAQNADARTPLHEAAHHGWDGGVIAPLRYGADKDKADESG